MPNRNTLYSLCTVYKQTPLGHWTPREAGWVIYREDSSQAATKVRKHIEKGNIMREAPVNGSQHVLITTKELERYMRKRYPQYRLNEKAYMQGAEVRARYKVNIEE